MIFPRLCIQSAAKHISKEFAFGRERGKFFINSACKKHTKKKKLKNNTEIEHESTNVFLKMFNRLLNTFFKINIMH